MLDWDDKMQRECATSFIKPLELELINMRNKEKICKAAVTIVTDDDNAENKDLYESWIKVLETVVSRVELKFMSEHVMKIIQDLPGLKHPFPKRKRGNRLVFSVIKNVGEKGFNNEPLFNKLLMSICGDNNYKIRRDGCIFLKEYFKKHRASIITSDRFKDVYLPLVIDFLNDEDLHIQIDAIEAYLEIIDCLTLEEVEADFTPCVLNFLQTENQAQIEITQRIAELFGQIIYKLKDFDLHLKYQSEFIAYF